MGISSEIRQQLINSFKTEQREHVQQITQGLLALEKNPSPTEKQTLLDDIFRGAHSLKGGARAVGMTTIESLGHSLEDLLLAAKENRLVLTPELFDLLYQSLDAIELLMERLEANDPSPPAKVIALLVNLEEATKTIPPSSTPENINTELLEDSEANFDSDIIENTNQLIHNDESTTIPTSSQQDETIRVSVSKLDALMEQFSELLGAKIRAEQRLVEVREMQLFATDWLKTWQAARGHYNRLTNNNNEAINKDVKVLMEFMTQNQEQLRTLSAQSNTLYRQLSNDTLRMSLIINELQEEIKRVRMLPLATVTATFGRMVRDLAREQEKEINLTIIGQETELDKRVLEQIKDPLIHLLRNAIDHGLETPAKRKQAGKPSEGHLTLSATQQGNNIVISVSDDGNGLNLQNIRNSAIRKGFLSSAESKKLTDAETANLIFNSGLSTSEIITDISGRGVGLDVVRQNVEELHGTLEVSFIKNQGTTFTLTLPLTLASSHGLLVKASDQVFALPYTTVERMLQIDRSEVARINGKEAIVYEGNVALAWLEDLLDLPSTSHNKNKLTIVIIAVAEKRLGLVVDSLEGEQEIVMKSLGKQLVKVGGIAGATVLGSGQVILVLHSADLIKLAARTKSRATAITTTEQDYIVENKHILVVDDSITTRTLEKNILEAAGYRVQLATNGEEALATLVTGNMPNLVVSDINMPYLDGFELTNRIKQDMRYQDIPVILVTSLDSPADKAKGIEVGADAYIVKSSFDQGNLLETIEQLV